MKFKLSKYILPSIISMVVVGTNANVDGLFIGRILGDDGLAAINIVWPIVAFISSLGTGLGIGGAVIFNRIRGEGRGDTAESVKNTVLVMLGICGLVLGLLFLLLSKPILVLIGAEGPVLTHAFHYALVISAGAIFQVLGAGILVLLRNDHKTYQSMIYALVGLILHILFDFLLAERFVMYGVALSTVISQAVVAALGILTLKIHRNKGICGKYIGEIIKGTAAPFGINFVPSLVLLFTNYFALEAGGVAAVSAYAVMSYAVYTFDYIFQGVCDGIQPVISYCRGSGDMTEEKRALKNAAVVLAVVAGCCIVLTPVLIRIMPVVLAASKEAAKVVETGFWIYALSYPFKAAVKFVCSYYYVIGKGALSSMIVYLDPLLLTPLTLLVLTQMIGMNGVWLSMPVTQILLTLLCIVASSVGNKRKSAREA